MAIQQNTSSFPVEPGLIAVILRGKEAVEYKYDPAQKKNVPTDIRITDESGKPITRLTAFGVVNNAASEFTIEVPDALVADLNAEDVVRLHGSSMSAALRGGDYGSLRTTVTDVEKLEVVGRAVDLFKIPAPRKGE